MSERNQSSSLGQVKPRFRSKIIKCKETGEYKLITIPIFSHGMQSTHVMPSYKYTCRTCGREFESSEQYCPSCGRW